MKTSCKISKKQSVVEFTSALKFTFSSQLFIEDNIFTFISRLIVQVDDGNFIFSVVNYFHQNLYTKVV